ncbi:low molecular weight protein-tyrosine-phosphatase [Marinibactrum halimedae]|uniref:protein-tyrosine-phosphatase n=1 Tax=Marinibactrum halimedae TaxID=1444977 RepID=A0AA37T7T9_9GAMM|nr:low molecular weight protein-tyrosine-phosphatase [Marinibactrum halimedae]MCD9460049.1 low molecular weight phosphotyrosine protein phosphatase [Marinibactrum halimedae]GLS26447.1 phosphotyrosine protein phosphatase [Marinibactrum halimedae]
MSIKVLFVCLGNICRSPTAEGVFRHYVEKAGKSHWINIDSAGTGGWHIGASPDPRAQEAASQRGYSLSSITARQVSLKDFSEFDYILAMDNDNLSNLRALASETSFHGHLGLFLDFAKETSHREVPDPYYGGDAGFVLVLDLIEQASEGLLQAIEREHVL